MQKLLPPCFFFLTLTVYFSSTKTGEVVIVDNVKEKEMTKTLSKNTVDRDMKRKHAAMSIEKRKKNSSCLNFFEVSLSEHEENDSNFVTQSFASVSYLFPMAKLQWGLAEVRVMSRLRCRGNSPGERLCCISFPQLPKLHEWEQPHTASSCQTLHSWDLFPQALSVNNQTTGESLYWYFVLFILTKAVNNPKLIHVLQRWSSKWSVFPLLLELFCFFCSFKIIAWLLISSSYNGDKQYH